MFLKADGSEVWLQSSTRLPYLSLAGVIETSEDYLIVRSRLGRAYELLSGVASDDAFFVQELAAGCALIFCARSDKNCALVLLGKYDPSREKRKPCGVLEDLVEVIENSVDGIIRQAGATIRFEVVQPELAIRAG
ncbi:hypothetical protein [Mesorhizobium sp. 113-3-3]|uniref:hypothetical protein n=1 Tax=Mesorhizobium sp. 113-3-3 TaxID=2744516 RepID=UPI0018EC8C11|nr:hypothetical protein [Mesorhizobium sp. 113-3-3]BCG83590.1 hypothetical protein MesoLj113b_71320 [Mesorhizobium sp. 113-3-3]